MNYSCHSDNATGEPAAWGARRAARGGDEARARRAPAACEACGGRGVRGCEGGGPYNLPPGSIETFEVGNQVRPGSLAPAARKGGGREVR